MKIKKSDLEVLVLAKHILNDHFRMTDWNDAGHKTFWAAETALNDAVELLKKQMEADNA